MTDAHTDTVTTHTTVHYPAHGPRKDDPHYIDFEHYRKLHKGTAKCWVGERIGFDQCSLDEPIELHHTHIEWSLLNEVSWEALEHDYPGISDPNQVGAWLETEANLRFLCVYHHRGHGGSHVVPHAIWESESYVKDLTS